jgi:uncharacterized membrane protein
MSVGWISYLNPTAEKKYLKFVGSMSMNEIGETIEFLTALGCALMAGLFFAFSMAVMVALSRLPDASGMRAMQLINIAIVNPLFLVVFIGTAIGCLATTIIGLANWILPAAKMAVVGGIVYLLGSLLVTAIFNIPLNNRLAELEATDPQNVEFWHEYLAKGLAGK